MKLNRNIMAITIAVGLGVSVMESAQAANWIDTTKGPRLSTLAQEKKLVTLDDFKSLKKGDKLVASCPLMKETYVTTIRDVDSKGHVKIQETKKGYALGGCNIVLQKKAHSKEVDSVMVCPDGTLRPVSCKTM